MITVILADNYLAANGGYAPVYYQFENLPASAVFSIYFIKDQITYHTNRALVDNNKTSEPISTFEIIPLKPDLDGDGDVDLCDLYIFSDHWLQENDNPNWLQQADLHPDGRINMTDFACFSRAWSPGYY